jgi:hypothetical protein
MRVTASTQSGEHEEMLEGSCRAQNRAATGVVFERGASRTRRAARPGAPWGLVGLEAHFPALIKTRTRSLRSP